MIGSLLSLFQRYYSVIAGLAGLCLIAAFALRTPAQVALQPVDMTGALSVADYRLDWEDTTDATGRALLPDEVYAYSDFLRQALSGQLAYADPKRVEVDAQAALSPAPIGVDPHQTIRLQSRVRPKLVLQNHSLAVFDVETDILSIRYNHDYSRFLEARLKTVTETIRIADTRIGLVVRHVEPVQAPSDFSRTDGRRVPVTGQLGGINYYPTSAPWGDFWTEFPLEEITEDFAQIRSMGANSIRVFLTRSAFEDPDYRQVSLGRLKQLLDMAHRHDLQVILTCFDMGVSYELAAITQSWAHLRRILEIADQHPAVTLIDLKNEPDLDYKRWGAARVDLWLSTLLNLAQATYPDLAFTIGWSNAGAASALAQQVDVVSFHDFEALSNLSDRVAYVRRVAGQKPVMLTEIGHSRWPSLPGRMQQSERLSRQLHALSDLDGVLVWTLNDFDQIPNEVAGWRPWRKAMQAHYGLSESSREQFARFLCDFLDLADNQTCTGDTL